MTRGGADLLRDRVTAAVGDAYDIQDEIGRGARGVVYRALDLRLHRLVALKVLPPDLAFDEAVRRRFLLEAQTAASLAHAHIVPIHAVDERRGVAYLVMPLVEGESLATRLRREPTPPLPEVRRILREVADALAHAHARGVVHRDIKPDNILLDRETGRALVTDFGIARATEEGQRLTVTGVALGTPAYMSPEQAHGEREIDGRSDVYSLGVVGYQMLAGEPPFRASSGMALMMKHVTEAPRPLRERRPAIPPLLAAAIERALAKRPDDRWPTAAMFRDAIAREESMPRGAEAPPAPGRPAWLPPLGPPPDVHPPVPRNDRMSRREARRAMRRDEESKPIRERIRGFRRQLMSNGAVIAGLATINGLTSPEFPWFLFPASGMLIGLGARWAGLWADGVRMKDVLAAPPRPAELDAEPHAEPAPRDRTRVAAPSTPPLPAPPRAASLGLEQLVPVDVLHGERGAVVRRAAEDRVAIREAVARLAPADRDLLPDVMPTVEALLGRVASLAQMLHRIDVHLPPGTIEDAESRLVSVEHEPPSSERDRRLALLRRQRATLQELSDRRIVLGAQLESASLALANLRLDLIKLRSAGVQAAIDELAEATQEARALSRDIGVALDAAADIKAL
ncbi:MAG TPA: protein kinase [Gemmatimonadaceae bacterium]